MTANRLAKSTEPVVNKKDWSLDDHCDHANKLLVEKGTNEARAKDGFGPVHWTVRDGRVVIAFGHPPGRYLAFAPRPAMIAP